MRASDAERERTTQILSRAAAAGQLDVDELDERLQAALAARSAPTSRRSPARQARGSASTRLIHCRRRKCSSPSCW